MNIFVLDENPKVAAMQHFDKHVPKMVLETAQMLCTAHRVLDGKVIKQPSKSGKRLIKHYELNTKLESILYKACHVNHPCSRWIRESKENYQWAYALFESLSNEFEYRFGKKHKSWIDLSNVLINCPKSIHSIGLTQFVKAMGSQPNCLAIENPIEAYRSFYKTKPFEHKWTKRETPIWYEKQ
jgi:hypothetical protein